MSISDGIAPVQPHLRLQIPLILRLSLRLGNNTPHGRFELDAESAMTTRREEGTYERQNEAHFSFEGSQFGEECIVGCMRGFFCEGVYL